MSFIGGFLAWIGNNKLSSFLIVCLFAFIVSTWTLAAVNSNLNSEIDDLKRQINDLTPTQPPPPTDGPTPPVTDGSTPPATDTPPTNETEPNLRLNKDIKPILYDLFLHPDLQTGIFNGNVTIDLDIQSTIDEIAIHTHLLNISTVDFHLPDSNVRVASFWHDDKMEQLKIALTEPVTANNRSSLHIEFSGLLKDKIIGFYRSTYKDASGNDR